MKIGDTVRFLSEVGGGRVSGFKGKNIVLVEDEDGFEIPMLMNDVVVINEEKERNSLSDSPQTEGVNTQASRTTEEPKLAGTNYESPSGGERRVEPEISGHDRLSLYLSFLPVEVKELSQTNFESYLVNDSNYYVQVLLMSAEGAGWRARFCAVVEPNSKVFVEEFDRSELNGLERLCVQTIAWKQERVFALKPAVTTELRLDLTKFYKLHVFRPNEFFHDPNLTVPVIENDKPIRSVFVDAEQVKEAIEQAHIKEADKPKSAAPKAEKKKKEGPIEVNLHIEELMDTTAGLSSGDILMAQMNEFRRVMDENLQKKGQKIVFIHGKGEGVLRKNILQELKYRYKGCTWQDASFREYGFGATMVKVG